MAIVTEVFDEKDDESESDDDDGGGGGEEDDEEREFGQLMGFNEVMKVVEEKGEELPARRDRD